MRASFRPCACLLGFTIERYLGRYPFSVRSSTAYQFGLVRLELVFYLPFFEIVIPIWTRKGSSVYP
jgi:hypothetical protein